MPDPAIAGEFGAPFAEQLAFFRQKMGNLVPTERWDDMIGEAHDTGFMVAGATKADLLTDLSVAVDKAIAEGRGIDEFRRDFRAIVAKNGWTGWTGEGTVQGEAWRVKTILRTNAYTSYAAGRYAQLAAEDWPLWVYHHGGSLEPRIQHLDWDGLALEPSHDFWQKFYPPSGWGCSCYVTGARSARGVKRLGGDPDKKLPADWAKIDPKTGEPKGISKGWGYAPGASVWQRTNFFADKLGQLPAPIGAAFGASVSAEQRTERADAFSSFVDEVLADEVRGRNMIVGTLQPSWIRSTRAQGVEPETAEIMVTDRAIWHTFRDGKTDELNRDWYKRLPEHLVSPRAVLLDKSKQDHPVLLLVFDGPSGSDRNKLVISVNYKVKKVKGDQNVVISGRETTPSDIRAIIGRGEAVLLEGEL